MDAAPPVHEIVFTIIAVLLTVAAIFYMIYAPEGLAGFTGFAGRGKITTPSPPWLIRFAGCAALAVPIGAAGWAL